MDGVEIIGVLGAFILLIGFGFNQTGKWNVNDFEYDLINLIASLILLFYSYLIGSVTFMLIYAVWGIFSVKDIVEDVVNKK